MTCILHLQRKSSFKLAPFLPLARPRDFLHRPKNPPRLRCYATQATVDKV